MPDTVALTTLAAVILYVAWLLFYTWAVRNSGRATKSLQAVLCHYALAIFLPLIIFFSSLQWWKLNRVRPPDQGAIEKVAWYRQNAGKFNLLFVGDSRAYCAMHPEKIDPLLGSRSFNLSYWAHWFPTQYLAMKDILEAAPPDTFVVWCIGYQNFQPVSNAVGVAYPIGARNVERCQQWGFSRESLRENLERYGNFDIESYIRQGREEFTLTGFLGLPAFLRGEMDGWAKKKILSLKPEEAMEGRGSSKEAALRRQLDFLLEQARRDPSVRESEIRTENDGDRLTSLALVYSGGGYERIELDHEYFRQKQQEFAAELTTKAAAEPVIFEADTAYWNNFVGILDLFAGRGEDRLIVAEMAEAPHTYLNPERKARYKRFMTERVRPFVRQRGHSYVQVDWSSFTDEDYFDYNHLNRKGIEKFTPLFVEAIRSLENSRLTARDPLR